MKEILDFNNPENFHPIWICFGNIVTKMKKQYLSLVSTDLFHYGILEQKDLLSGHPRFLRKARPISLIWFLLASVLKETWEDDSSMHSTDNFLSLVHILLRIFDTSPKKRDENDKNTNFLDEKQQKNAKRKVYVNISILYSELAPLTRDVTCSKLQRYGENTGDKKLSVEQTPSFSRQK